MTDSITEQEAQTKPKKEPTFWTDKRVLRKGEKLGGGFIVAKRGRDSGRYRMTQWPFEHPNLDSAKAEAQKLAEKHQGQEFVILQEVPGILFTDKSE